jgi:ATP-dependent DNA helicase PIF1
MCTLSTEQQICFDKYVNKENLFITGPGGTGKSFLIKSIVKHAEDNNKNIKVCALTGCAAILLECKATTLHMFSGIGIANKKNEDIVNELFTKNRHKLKNWRKLEILIIDEVSMMSLKIFLLLDLIAKKYYNCAIPFGGLQVIFTGDFYQLSPVFSNATEKEESMYCFQHELWNQLFLKTNQIVLKTIFRQSDELFVKVLKYIRKGQISPSAQTALESRIIDKTTLEQLKKEKVLTILSPIKRDVETINNKEYTKLENGFREFEYNLTYIDLNDKSENDDTNNNGNKNGNNNIENTRLLFELYLKSNNGLKKDYEFLANNIIAEKTLKLKVGTQVMCIANITLCGELHIANGSQGTVVGFNEKNMPCVKFNNITNPIVITNFIWKSEHNKRVAVSQIPLIYSWAITIHKAQGLTLDNAIIDIGSNIFAYGQTYVALSRVKSLNGLYLTHFDYTKILCNPIVKKFYGDV